MGATEATFRDVVRAVRSVTEPTAVILYGSYASGTANDRSDIDLLVIRKTDFLKGESRRRELGRIYRAAAELSSIPKDIILLSRSEFETWRATSNHVASEAIRRGRLLYGQI